MTARVGDGLSGRIEVATIRSLEEIEELRVVWERLQWHPNADLDFFLQLVSMRETVVQPYCVLVSVDGAPALMAVGRIEEAVVPLAPVFRSRLCLRARILTVNYGGLMGDGALSRILFDQLYSGLVAGDADILALPLVESASPLLVRAKEVSAALSRGLGPRTQLHWQMSLPDSLEALFLRFTKKQRYNLRRPRKLLEKQYEGQVEFVCLRDPGDVDRLGRDVESIARHTYQRALGAGFVLNSQSIRRLELQAARQLLRGYLLLVRGEPVAFWLCLEYKRTLHLEHTGYLERLRDFEPGKVLLHWVFEQACSNSSVDVVDFGLGDAAYKRRYGTHSWQEQGARIYAPRWRGALFGAVQSAPTYLERLAVGLIERLGLEHRARRALRSFKQWQAR